jgi:hypothetical protein
MRKYMVFYNLQDRPDEYILAEIEAEDIVKAIEKFRREYDFERAIVLFHALIIDARTGEKEEYCFDRYLDSIGL